MSRYDLDRNRRASLHRLKLRKGCADCLTHDDADHLEFCHRDPAQRIFAIGDGLDGSWEGIWSEILKCDVVCRRCRLKRQRHFAVCSECNSPVYAKNLCRRHYLQQRRRLKREHTESCNSLHLE
jgi:hypothetical protein